MKQVNLTNEQQKILDCTDRFLLVAACPGAGKSTTAREVAKKYPSAMMLTFGREDKNTNQKNLSGNTFGISAKNIVTIDALSRIALIQNNPDICSIPLDDATIFDKDNANLPRMADIFYKDGWMELKTKVVALIGKRKSVCSKLTHIFNDYCSTGKVPNNKKSNYAFIPAYIDNMVLFIRNYELIDTVLNQFTAKHQQLFTEMEYGSETNLVKSIAYCWTNKKDYNWNLLLNSYLKYKITGISTNVDWSQHAARNLMTKLDAWIDNIEYCTLAYTKTKDFLTDKWTQVEQKNGWFDDAIIQHDTGCKNKDALIDELLRASLGYNTTQQVHKAYIDLIQNFNELKDLNPNFILAPISNHFKKSFMIGELSTEFYKLIVNQQPGAPELLQKILDDRHVDMILVDEAQHLSVVQAHIVNEFGARTDVKIRVFFDGDQSMYSFRGAVGDLGLKDWFLPGRTLMHMSMNFRTVNDKIIDLANAVRSHLISSGKDMTQGVHTGDNEAYAEPIIRRFASDNDEITAIITYILNKCYTSDKDNIPAGKDGMNNICIIARTKSICEKITKGINAYGNNHPNRLCVNRTWDDSKSNTKGSQGGYITETMQLTASMDGSAGVQVKTFHQAKGREFNYVWIAGLEDRVLPLNMTGENLTAAQKEEEIRILYVGITRAKRELIMSCAGTRDTINKQAVDLTGTMKPSEFIKYKGNRIRNTVIPKWIKIETPSKPADALVDDTIISDQEILDTLKKVSNAKYGNKNIVKAFRKMAQNTNLTDSERSIYLKRADRIEHCSDTLVVSTIQDSKGNTSLAITNNHACKDAACEVCMVRHSKKMSRRLENAMSLLDSVGAGLHEFTYNNPMLPDKKQESIDDKFFADKYIKVGKGSAAEKVNKSMTQHRNFIFATITMPSNIPISEIGEKKSHNRNPMQQLMHGIRLAFNSTTKGRTFARKNMNGYWSTCETTCKSPTTTDANGKIVPDYALGSTQEPECHVHCHLILDMNEHYTKDMKHQGAKYEKLSNGSYKYKNNKRIPVLDSNGNQVYEHEWSDYIRDSLESAGISFTQVDKTGLPYIVVKIINPDKKHSKTLSAKQYIDTTITDVYENKQRSIYEEVTKYSTKPSSIYPKPEKENPVWNSQNEVQPYVCKEFRDEAAVSIASAAKGLRLQFAGGSIKEAMAEIEKLDDKYEQQMKANQIVDNIMLVFGEGQTTDTKGNTVKRLGYKLIDSGDEAAMNVMKAVKSSEDERADWVEEATYGQAFYDEHHQKDEELEPSVDYDSQPDFDSSAVVDDSNDLVPPDDDSQNLYLNTTTDSNTTGTHVGKPADIDDTDDEIDLIMNLSEEEGDEL